jgi:hypothetical protein
LEDIEYMVILDDYCTLVNKVTDATVVQTATINGIYVIYLNQLILLQELKLEQNLKMNAAIEEEDEQKLLHERTGHVNSSTLVEALRCCLVTSYVQTFTDHASKYVTAYGLKEKSEALKNLKKYIENDSKKLEDSIKHYHADGAGKLVGRETLDYLDSRGVSYSWSPTDTPEMNSVTERRWRTLNEMTCCLLIRSGLSTDFWWDAYEAAVWIHNRTPTNTARGWMTPYEFVHGEPLNISNLRIWGC